MSDPLVQCILQAIERGLDERQLRRDLARLVASPSDPAASAASAASSAASSMASSTASELLSRIVLADILDDGILNARPHDKTFALRLFFGALGEHLASSGKSEKARDTAFVLASALNLYFRAELDEEAHVRIGFEASRLYYSFARAAGLEKDLVAQAAPLLASLLGHEIERLRFESVEHVPVFDSQLHERDRGSDPHASRVIARASFLVRVVGNNMVRMKALVRT